MSQELAPEPHIRFTKHACKIELKLNKLNSIGLSLFEQTI